MMIIVMRIFLEQSWEPTLQPLLLLVALFSSFKADKYLFIH